MHIRGLGRGLLYSLARIAQATKARRLWGEATELSFTFYNQMFQIESVDDLFSISARRLANFRRVTEVRWHSEN